ncbi:TPA: hypothetical protein NJ458_003237 [Vibrio parahaemolyticus]|uniref:hypothetical protein n=1 Tax=Vibrio parahaemolyticus TaxID=670 RepID=UPI00215C0080|nr:hypothetical protein [Vibrio parahaemolyticus]ELA6982978.1 hypothetical protein [Vibrio parahaemolyticus]MCR9869286.1 hypothetical protein [Vibrio parahaemolyticus]HCG7764520.1 hypothetical protein [Vibrio parahaemolyticus]
MNLGNVAKSLTSYVYEKATSPFLWVFAVCFALDHWNDLLVLFFSKDDVYAKIAYISNSIEKSTVLSSAESSFYYILAPLLSALVISFSYPLLTIFASACYDFSLYARNNISFYFDSKKFLNRSDSLELKNERTELIETFTKQLQDNQKQLRESQQQFMYSQSNCAALFCALGFSKGFESLLPYSDLFSSFVAKTEQHRDLLIGFDALNSQQTGSRDYKVSDLISGVRKLDFLPSLEQLSDEQLLDVIIELVEIGAIVPSYRRVGGGKDQVKTDTNITLSPNGRKFVKSMNFIRNGQFSHAVDVNQQ